jgi:biotin carboxyl carrier protein
VKTQVAVNDRIVEVDPAELAQAREVQPGVYSIVRDGKSYEVRVVASDTGFVVDIRGQRFQTEIRDPRSSSGGPRAGVSGGRQNIVASMPGKVVRILVQEAQEIAAGDGIVVVEAMKMQNEMKASKPGKISSIKARDGDTVAAGDVLVVIEALAVIKPPAVIK